MNEIQEAILLGAKEIHNLRGQNKLLQERLDFIIEQNDKKQQVIDKIKEYIKENANANVDYILELLEEIE